MEGWQIGVLVVMCVVFVVGVVLLCFLIYRFWGGVDSAGSTAVDEETKHHRAELYEDVDRVGGGVADDVVLAIPDSHLFARFHLKASNHVLHYLDLQRLPKSVDFHHERAVTTGADLQQYLARVEGMDDPDTISLTYLNARNELVDMDLDRLITRDAHFAKRMRHTAERPLLIGRLTELVVGGGDAGGITPNSITSAATLANPFGSAARDVDVNVTLAQTQQHQQQQQQPYDAQYNRKADSPRVPPSALFQPALSGGVSMPAPSASPVFPPVAGTATSVSPTGQRAWTNEDVLPTPIIFPSTHAASGHVTTRTPIFILAARYTIRPPGTVPPGVIARPTAVTDEPTVKALERGMAGEHPRSFYLDHGAFAHYTATVDPDRGLATLQHPSGTRYELVRSGVPVIKYSIDRTTSAQWAPFRGPFYLPPGRWCVRAKAVAEDDEATSAVVAKVFTVNVV